MAISAAELRERTTLTVEEAGQALGVGRHTAYDLIDRDELPHLRLGRRIVVPAQAVRHLLGMEAGE